MSGELPEDPFTGGHCATATGICVFQVNIANGDEKPQRSVVNQERTAQRFRSEVGPDKS